MKIVIRLLVIIGSSVLATTAHSADQVINLPECIALQVDELHELAIYALTKRHYNIEEDTPALLVGEQDKHKVEIVIQPPTVVIRWKEGFGYSKDLWLRNLKTDMLWRLAE